VRYIKLGQGGGLAAECIADGFAYLGFGLERPERFGRAQAEEWAALREGLLVDESGSPGAATNASHQIEAFFDGDPATVWLTFHGGRLYWTHLAVAPPVLRPGRSGVWRRVTGWKDRDGTAELLDLWRLSSDLTKLARFQGTSCEVTPPRLAEYARLRINGRRSPAVRRAEDATERLLGASIELLRLLHWRDFETFVDLIFERTGWRRLGPVGGIERRTDLDLEQPTTGQRAFVQVKAQASRTDFDEYVSYLREAPQYDFMFFAYHRWQGGTEPDEVVLAGTSQSVKPLGPRRLVEMGHAAGLLGWLLEKAPG